MPSATGNLSKDLALLKSHSSEYVAELAKSELMLDVEVNDIGHLTCIKVL